jgi:hypothetical protein
MIRVFIAAYVWMTGFGNFSYFYVRKDYSMVRLAKMMFRLNFLVTVVCLTLQRQYMLYYVCALHTFAFLQVYVTMYVGHAHNEKSGVIPAKLALLFCANALLFDVPGVFETVFAPAYALLGYNGSMHEWHFRTHLDHYMVVFGMACAYVHPHATALLMRLGSASPATRAVIKTGVAGVCVCALAAWYTLVLTKGNKYVYNPMHPYTAWLPVLIYIVLRNIFTGLRNTYMHLFAFLGTTTLETYLLQLHIWLQADAKAVTLYFPNYRLLNFAFASGIYLFLSWSAFKVTVNLSDALVPRNAELRNVAFRIAVLAAAFLLPISSLVAFS